MNYYFINVQVMRRDGKWFETIPEPNTIMMNIGDLMHRWTADKFISTVRLTTVLCDAFLHI